jgi:small subunit ribosomal protein S15
MVLAKEVKQQIIEKHGKNSADTGSIQAQIALLSERIQQLTQHFLEHPKDHSSTRGLLKLVSRRTHLLAYLRKHDEKLIEELNIRK